MKSNARNLKLSLKSRLRADPLANTEQPPVNPIFPDDVHRIRTIYRNIT